MCYAQISCFDLNKKEKRLTTQKDCAGAIDICSLKTKEVFFQRESRLMNEAMAIWHLDEIENSLNRIGWTVIDRIPPSEDFIGGWVIKRSSERVVDFDGLYDWTGNIIKNPSLEKADSCKIRDTDISLGFYKKGKRWNSHLHEFIHNLNKLK